MTSDSLKVLIAHHRWWYPTFVSGADLANHEFACKLIEHGVEVCVHGIAPPGEVSRSPSRRYDAAGVPICLVKSDFIRTLKTHIEGVLVPGTCIDKDSGGWKLSSTSENTWLSKIFLNQYICEQILDIQPAVDDDCDEAHVSWQKEACDITAATDQVDSRTGEALGSRLYPRLVTAVLWVEYAQ